MACFAASPNTCSTGSQSVTVFAPPPPTISVTFAGLSGGTSIARDACLTISASQAAAYECGDLRIVHPLPTTTTMGRGRTPVMYYNSRQAKPVTFLPANVLVSNMTPTSVTATVSITGHSVPSRTYSWNSACNGQWCRIVVPVDAIASTLATGAYDYTLIVQPRTARTLPPLQLRQNAKTGMKHILAGPEVHEIEPGGPPVEHYNYEQQAPTEKPGRFRQVNDVHLDKNGHPIP